MLQSQLQTAEYWETEFSLLDSDLEQIYNYFLETEKPHTANELADSIIRRRVRDQVSNLKRLVAGSIVYQPQRTYAVGEEVVFPALKMAKGTVAAVRQGFNPEHGSFSVIQVTIKGKTREFAADLKTDHALNTSDGDALIEQAMGDQEEVLAEATPIVAAKIGDMLGKRDDFVNIGSEWFVKSLMSEVNIGHLHLTEAIIEFSDEGPLTTAQILPQLELDPGVDQTVQSFSLNHALMGDDRFDQVSPTDEPRWYLKRMEPDSVRVTPERLVYEPVAYDPTYLTPQLQQLEQELDDEWSSLPAAPAQPVMLTLTFPHRWAGTLPLNSRTSALFGGGRGERQYITFIDDETNEEIAGWVVGSGRYVYGLSDWYQANSMPVGGFIHLRPGPNPGTVMLGYDRRRPQREWVRLASVVDNRISFELQRRSIQAGYDDLLIVGTDVVAALDAHWKRVITSKRGIPSLLAELFPTLAALSPQNTVHAKTLYSAVNMLKRLPPAPIFAELVRHPAFKSVGDHYWQFDSTIWHD